MLASIGDAVGAPAALVLPKKCPSSSAVDSTSPQDPLLPPFFPPFPPLPPPFPLPLSLHAGDRFSPQKHGLAFRESIGCK